MLWAALDLSCVGIGLSWYALTASFGKESSSEALAPEITTDWKFIKDIISNIDLD